MVGTTLGHYRIVQLLGRGGMGEVYKAEDTRLHREVAIKLLARELADDPDRRERFEREARAVAALNHPNIVTIHSVEEAGAHVFLTLELVDGQTLAAHIPEKGLALERLLDYAIPLADAVGAAHQRGITHRDLKPANVMVTPEGRVKVLDFGLAKLKETVPSVDTIAPTMELTGEGRVLGTAAYMSPEQAEGKAVDARSDVFSLGVMLHEMSTGERPFKGDTQVALMSAIIKDTPSSVTELRRDLPRALARIVQRCLKKDPEDRYQTAKDLRNELRALKEDLESGELQRPAAVGAASLTDRKRRTAGIAVAIGVAAMAIAAAAFALYSLGRRETPGTPATGARHFQNVTLTRLTNLGTAGAVALSGDGKYVAYVMTQDNKPSIWLRQVQTGSTVEIVPATAAVRYVGLSFSPDSNYLYYSIYAEGRDTATLYQMPVLGGGARRVLDEIDGGISFSPDGSRFAFVRGSLNPRQTSVMVADTRGDNVRALATRKWPSGFLTTGVAWAPDGKSIAVGALAARGALRVDVVLVDTGTGEERPVGTTQWRNVGHLAWVPDGTALLLNAQDAIGDPSNQIWILPYPAGEPRRITNDLNTYFGLSVAENGKAFVTVLSDRRTRIWVVPVGDESKAQPITTGAGSDDAASGIAWTPDGRIVYTNSIAGNGDIWVMDADGRNRVPLTNTPDNEMFPRVSADGQIILFTAERSAQRELWRMDRDGGRQKRIGSLHVSQRQALSADGKWAYYTQPGGANFKISIEGGEPVPLVADEAERKKLPNGMHEPVPSPDGRLIAAHYVDEAQNSERIVVLAESGPVAPKLFPTVPISMVWAPDSQSLVYWNTQGATSNFWRQPLSGGSPVQLTHFTSERIFSASLSPDGRRLAVVRGDLTSDVVLVSER